MGGDRGFLKYAELCCEFQSTPPVWAETCSCLLPERDLRDFNPLRPCGRRPSRIGARRRPKKFQSTPPVWAETRHRNPSILISEFQSTPPVWAETRSARIIYWLSIFQSTPPVWAETVRFRFSHQPPPISIHSARVGGDLCLPM